MAISFRTDDPKGLLKAFNERIHQTDPKGKITTWERSEDGRYYTHKAHDWRFKAWFLAVIEKDFLIFNIIKPGNAVVSSLAYAYYHGHLGETFLNHFDTVFSQTTSSAMPTVGDVIR